MPAPILFSINFHFHVLDRFGLLRLAIWTMAYIAADYFKRCNFIHKLKLSNLPSSDVPKLQRKGCCAAAGTLGVPLAGTM